MSETKTVERDCVLSTFDEEIYVAGRTYQVAEELCAKYPHSFKPVGCKDTAEAEQVKADQVKVDLAKRTQAEYEKARDHAFLMEVDSELSLRRQRKELEEQLLKQREENLKMDREAVEISGWAPKPPPLAEPAAPELAPAAQTSAPQHTLPRAERLKNAR